MSATNLYQPDHTNGETEIFTTLLNSGNTTIQRIISPIGFTTETMVQPYDEWFCLLQGNANLQLHDESIELHPGDTYFIPANTSHRIVTAAELPSCIWLAVHIA